MHTRSLVGRATTAYRRLFSTSTNVDYEDEKSISVSNGRKNDDNSSTLLLFCVSVFLSIVCFWCYCSLRSNYFPNWHSTSNDIVFPLLKNFPSKCIFPISKKKRYMLVFVIYTVISKSSIWFKRHVCLKDDCCWKCQFELCSKLTIVSLFLPLALSGEFSHLMSLLYSQTALFLIVTVSFEKFFAFHFGEDIWNPFIFYCALSFIKLCCNSKFSNLTW